MKPRQQGKVFFGWWMVLALFLILFNTAGVAQFVTEGAEAEPPWATLRPDR